MTFEKALKILDETVIGNLELKIVLSKALEKQIPQRPDFEGDGYDENGMIILDTWICPCCEETYETDYEHYDRCPNCGQTIDWSEEE